MPGKNKSPIHEARLSNFRALLSEREMCLSHAAALLGKSPAQVSHFGGKSPIKNIGESVAREIERAFGMPTGWLDATPYTTDPFAGLDDAVLTQADTWVRFEESRPGPYAPRERHSRLLSMAALAQSNGGTILPDGAENLLQSLSLRRAER